MATKKRGEIIGLHPIRQIGNDAAIIFVHGLRGDPFKTWTKKDCQPLPLLMENDSSYGQFDIFTFGYTTGVFLKRNHFKDVAKLLYTELKARTSYKKLYFIAHSMGGLVVQSLLIHQVERGNVEFINSVKGIIYLAVPFFGASGGSIAAFAYTILPPLIGEYALSNQVRSLKFFGKDLEEQAEKWVQYSNDQTSHIIQKNICGQDDLTVHRFSAKPPYIQDADVVAENHRSICKMETNSTVYLLISQFFQKKKHDHSSEQIESYNKWLLQKTSKFVVPGINIPLSIEDAWASLQVWERPSDSPNETLKTKIAQYHEWETLTRKRGLERNAQDVTSLGKRVVIIGGPGSGKSTLAKRTVHKAASHQQKVIFVKLSNISKEMALGKSFEDALWSNATQGYPKNLINQRPNILQDPDIIVADGLDECSSYLREVSEALRDWSEGRPQMRVIITTRPIGYEPAFFYDYYHVEILPLDEREINDYAKKLIEELMGSDQVETFFKEFKNKLEKSKTASVAARSPLLLNFLIQLSVLGKTFGAYRTELYAKILEEWMSTASRGENLELNQPIALRSLEWIGWTLQQHYNHNGSGYSKSDLVSGLAQFLMTELNLKKLEAKERAAICLKYWTEKGLLEPLKVGFENTYTFRHLSLGEYAAACYFASMPEEKQREILLKYYRTPVWREIFLLAGGVGSAQLIVEQLLLLDIEKDDIFNDMVLAAAVLLETDASHDLNKQVIERLSKTIKSPFAILAYEAIGVYGGLAEQAPEWTLSFTVPLLNHPQYWTRLVATNLSLKADYNVFTPNNFINWLTETPKESKSIFKGEILSGWGIWNETIILGLEQLMKGNISEDEITSISEVLSNVSLNLRSVKGIQKISKKYEITNLFSPFLKKFTSGLGKINFQGIEKQMIIGELSFVQHILEVIPKKEEMIQSNRSSPLIQFALLMEGMEVGEQIAGDLYILSKADRREEVHTVLSGMIAVLNIDVDALYDELQYLLNHLKKSDVSSTFYHLPDVPSEQPNWSVAPTLDLDLYHLVSALGHSSDTIALNSAKLLASGVGGEKVKPIMLELLDNGNEQFFRFSSMIIPELFQEEAIDVILQRLGGKPSSGFQYLYNIMTNLQISSHHEQVCQVLIQGIQNNNENVAKAASKALFKIAPTIDQIMIKDALFHWDKNGVPCHNCNINVKGASCPNCSIVPPSPLPELLAVMSKNDILQFDEWIKFCNHPRSDVKEAASKGFAKSLSNNTLKLSDLISDIREGKQAPHLLDTIFNIDTNTLIKSKRELTTLLESKIPNVRKRLIKEVAVGKWLHSAEAIHLYEKALDDKHPVVRNQAVLTARSLSCTH